MNKQLQYKGFVTTLQYSEEDKLYWGSIDNIKDTVCFHGTTIHEAEHYFHEAVDTYLNDLKYGD